MTLAGDDWLELDLQDRRYITVVGDEAPQRQDEGFGEILDGIDASEILPLAPIAIPLLLTPFGILAGAVVAFAALQKYMKPSLKILRITRSRIGKVDFGPDGWEPDVVYAAHPARSTMYRALATFHEELFVQKMAELERLLNALGAKEYAISHVQSRARSAGARVEVASMIGGEASAAGLDLIERKWSGTSVGRAPRLPEGMVWYANEPEWQSLAESRFAGSRRKFAFSVRHNQDFGVDAQVARSILAAKLEIGGSFKSVKHVEFSVTGTF